MACDEELEQLTNQVHDLLGGDVLSAAVSRAISAAMQQARPVELSSSLELSGISDSDGYWTSMSVFYEALKIELRRILRPH